MEETQKNSAPPAFEDAILDKQAQFGQYGVTADELELVPIASRALFVKLAMQVAALMNQNEKLAEYIDRGLAQVQTKQIREEQGKPKLILPNH